MPQTLSRKASVAGMGISTLAMIGEIIMELRHNKNVLSCWMRTNHCCGANSCHNEEPFYKLSAETEEGV